MKNGVNIKLVSHVHNNTNLPEGCTDVLVNVEFLDEKRKEKYGDDIAGFTSIFFAKDTKREPYICYVKGGTDHSHKPFTSEEEDLIADFARGFLKK